MISMTPPHSIGVGGANNSTNLPIRYSTATTNGLVTPQYENTGIYRTSPPTINSTPSSTLHHHQHHQPYIRYSACPSSVQNGMAALGIHDDVTNNAHYVTTDETTSRCLSKSFSFMVNFFSILPQVL